MLPKKGIVFPNNENLGPYPRAIAYALKCELGSTHQAVKIIMRWTGAGERSVKNWLAGISGPSGQHLVDLIRNSDDVLAILLILAGRRQVLAAQRLIDVRNRLAETIQQIDAMMGEYKPGD
jgi:hypothetical protein